MIAYLKLLRWPNLIFIALTLILIKFSFFEEFGAAITLNAFGYALLILATLCIAASGYVINDIYDIQADKINKPEKLIVGNKISEKKANNLFIILNIIGVAIGFYLANLLGKTCFCSNFHLFFSFTLFIRELPKANSGFRECFNKFPRSFCSAIASSFRSFSCYFPSK